MTKLHGKRQSALDVLKSLHAAFGKNVCNLDDVARAKLEGADLRARALYSSQEELSKLCGSEPHRESCSSMIPEIFADFSISAYLLVSGLIVPARMLCRRAFETGIAIIYLWDSPTEFYRWTKFDGDLSFGSMVEYLASKEFGAHVSEVNHRPFDSAESFIDLTHARQIYRKLSNTVHGKRNDLPPLSPDRYSPDSDTISRELALLIETQAMLIAAYRGRFPVIHECMEREFPSLNHAR